MSVVLENVLMKSPLLLERFNQYLSLSLSQSLTHFLVNVSVQTSPLCSLQEVYKGQPAPLTENGISDLGMVSNIIPYYIYSCGRGMGINIICQKIKNAFLIWPRKG